MRRSCRNANSYSLPIRLGVSADIATWPRTEWRSGIANALHAIGEFSLDAANVGDPESTSIDRLEDADVGLQAQYISKERATEIQEAIARVRKRIGELGWSILQERLTRDQPQTLEDLGRRWGVSRERVRQVEVKTKTFLARYLSAFNEEQETAVAGDAA